MRLRIPLPFLRICAAPAIIGLIGLLLVLAAIDPVGSYPNAPEGPGLTLDEPFNVEQGVYLARAVRSYGLALLHPESIREVFGNPVFLPDHPPLGRAIIGMFHELTIWLVPPADGQALYATACARTAPAFVFALLIFLVGTVTGQWYGRAAGLIASVALLLMPRVFGHAHLAALETMMGFTYAAVILSVALYWKPIARVSYWTAAATGCVLGLALLTKIQAILLPAAVGLWALYHGRTRAIGPLIVWFVVGFAVFFAGWPWLWLDPIEHLKEYFGRTTGRVELFTMYFGTRYASGDIPWHYPWVLFLTTVPLGLQCLGICGLFRGERGARIQPREQLVLAGLLAPLVLFSLPSVGVYDGARLFLVSFPLWAVFIGRGGAALAEWLATKYSHRTSYVLAVTFLAAQTIGLLTYSPCHLSYYNLLVGGLPGAERLGLTTTYWGDSLTRDFLQTSLKDVPDEATVLVIPVLHYPLQLDAMSRELPVLRDKKLKLKLLTEISNETTEYLLFFRRDSDLPPLLHSLLPHSRLMAELRIQGVQLAALYAYDPPPSVSRIPHENSEASANRGQNERVDRQ